MFCGLRGEREEKHTCNQFRLCQFPCHTAVWLIYTFASLTRSHPSPIGPPWFHRMALKCAVGFWWGQTPHERGFPCRQVKYRVLSRIRTCTAYGVVLEIGLHEYLVQKSQNKKNIAISPLCSTHFKNADTSQGSTKGASIFDTLVRWDPRAARALLRKQPHCAFLAKLGGSLLLASLLSKEFGTNETGTARFWPRLELFSIRKFVNLVNTSPPSVVRFPLQMKILPNTSSESKIYRHIE